MSRGLGDVYKRQVEARRLLHSYSALAPIPNNLHTPVNLHRCRWLLGSDVRVSWISPLWYSSPHLPQTLSPRYSPGSPHTRLIYTALLAISFAMFDFLSTLRFPVSQSACTDASFHSLETSTHRHSLNITDAACLALLDDCFKTFKYTVSFNPCVKNSPDLFCGLEDG